MLSAGHGALHLVLSTGIAARALLLLLVLKAVAAAVSIGSGFRGGLFFASLLLGALLGKLFALGVGLALPAGVDAMLFAIVGMSAFGAAVIGAPLAMTFLALEATRDFAVGGAVLVAVTAAAMAVRRLFGYSFATWRFHLRGEAIRSPHDVGWLRDLAVGRLMRRGVRTVRTDTRISAFRREFPLGSVERVVAVDEAAEAEALAVVDGAQTRRVVGLLTEAHLLRRYGEELDKRRQEEVGMS